MNARNVYDGFIALEDRSAALYLELSARFFNNQELGWFWVEMAMEEKQHAGMLQHCRETGVYATQLPDKDQIENLNTLFRGLELRLEHPQLTLGDAFEIAIELETSEINDVYSKLTAPIQGPAHVMQKKIALSLSGHFDRIYDAAKRFHVSQPIQTRLANSLPRSGFGPQSKGVG
jgi:rubrerythrin